jgi:Flp pilus assembly protein TadD
MIKPNLLKGIAVFALLLLSACAELGIGGMTGSELKAIEASADKNANQNRHQDALEGYQNILVYQPNNQQVQLKAAKSAMALKLYTRALAYYNAVLSKSPSNQEALKGGGRAQMMLGQYGQAIPYFRKALDSERNTANYANLGVAYDMSNNANEAQRIYREALLQMPEDLNVRNNMALSMLLSGNEEGAIDVLQSVVANPKATGTHYANLALAYGLSGKTNAAKRTLQKILPSNDDVERNLEIYAELSELKGDSLRQAVLMGDVRGRDANKKDMDE